jgi:hypothetical protein
VEEGIAYLDRIVSGAVAAVGRSEMFRKRARRLLYRGFYFESLSRSSSDGYYHTLSSTGLDLVVKRCSTFAPLKSLCTKSLNQVKHERFFHDMGDCAYDSFLSLKREKRRISWESVRLRKKRLLDRLKCFSATSSHCYFFTITSKDGDYASEKRRFLYAFENARKRYQSLYGKMHYVGVLERHPKRNKHPFHAHFCAFFEGGYKRYEELWETFGKDIGRIHLEPVGGGIRGLANYSYKSMLDTIAAYFNKTEAPESILLASKGSPKPARTVITEAKAADMIHAGNLELKTFSLPTGGEVSFHYSDSWSEIKSIYEELSELEQIEQGLLAEEFMRSPSPTTHRR